MKFIQCCLIFLTTLILTSCDSNLLNKDDSEKQKVVHILNWTDYIDPSVITDFENKTGIKVRYDLFDTDESLEKIMFSKTNDYDLVFPSANFFTVYLENGLVHPLQKELLPNLSNIDKNFYLELESYDPGNKHAINYHWGTTGIAYLERKINILGNLEDMKTLKSIFELEYIKKYTACGIGIIDSPIDISTLVKLYLGIPVDNADTENLIKIKEILFQIAPFISQISTDKIISDLSEGNICLAIAYNGDALQAQQRARKNKSPRIIKYEIPIEGGIRWLDTVLIPKQAPNKLEAHQFLNYILDAKVSAKITNYNNYANSNKASEQYISEDIFTNQIIYPQEEVKSRIKTIKGLPVAYTKELNKIWTEFKGKINSR
ncbi:MAG: extracellular solute-binding protein [Methylacidiphilales bacterium]|nr:extracellular solute-binding protein [Candidatus Methylacidiphilales bacterium]